MLNKDLGVWDGLVQMMASEQKPEGWERKPCGYVGEGHSKQDCKCEGPEVGGHMM